MSSETKEIVVSLTPRRLLVLGIVVVLSVFSLYGYIMALFAFIAPSQDLPLEVTSVGTFDTGDASKTSFNGGETVRMKATVEKGTAYYYNYPAYYYYYDFVGDTSCKMIFAVMDDVERPVFFDSVVVAVSPGDYEDVSFDYTIPPGASPGSYVVRVMAWSDWLPDGVALSSDVGEVTFEVT